MPYILYYIVISLCNDDVSLRAALEPADKHRRWREMEMPASTVKIKSNLIMWERERKRKIVDHEGNQMHISGMDIMEFFFRTEFAWKTMKHEIYERAFLMAMPTAMLLLLPSCISYRDSRWILFRKKCKFFLPSFRDKQWEARKIIFFLYVIIIHCMHICKQMQIRM